MLLYQNQDRYIESRLNFVRLMQMLLCITCISLTFATMEYDSLTSLISYVFLMFSSGTFTIITTIDVSSRLFMLLAIQFKLWIMYAFTGGVVFWAAVCVYIGLEGVEKTFWVPTMLTMFMLTGVAFIWDAICIVFFRRYRVVPRTITISTTSTLENSTNKTSEGVVQIQREIETSGDDETRVIQQTTRVKYNPTPITYGGTFHMSKDVAPFAHVAGDWIDVDEGGRSGGISPKYVKENSPRNTSGFSPGYGNKKKDACTGPGYTQYHERRSLNI